jgi:uncharacterized protein (DUF885 family)
MTRNQRSIISRQLINVLVLLVGVLVTKHSPVAYSDQPTTLGQSRILEQMIREYSADIQSLDHRFQIILDEAAFGARRQLDELWLERLTAIDFSELDRSSQFDYLLLKGKLRYSIQKSDRDYRRDTQVAARWLPFSEKLICFLKNREDVNRIEPGNLAADLDQIANRIEATRVVDSDAQQLTMIDRIEGIRAVELLRGLRQSIDEADRFYSGYDPLYTWWCSKPMDRLKAALSSYQSWLQESVVGTAESDQDTIIGLPIGAEALGLELEKEWIAHSPQELVDLALREMSWCEVQLRAAAAEMGFGNDWKKALELVKSKHVPPGDQPEMIRGLALEAIQFLQQRELITIPPLAERGWRMTMMSPERQRVSPYFLGGDTIIVSYPTDQMSHEEKMMSLRSNNRHFARATVHHELIPGHHLQFHMLARHRTYRQLFATPFWLEGWALHWEMLLWDLNFAQSPEDRMGMLFWRKHRCARIVFSLGFHLGTMTPEQCVEYLVDQVGHERSAATAEVRRSVMGNYGPLYQIAYMVGGQQLRKLHQEMVGSGQMPQQQFHDAVLREHSIPIELLRDYLMGNQLDDQALPKWRFADLQ